VPIATSRQAMHLGVSGRGYREKLLTTLARDFARGAEFSGSWQVASRNSLLRFLATNAANAVPIGTINPAQPHPDGLSPHPSGELATTNFAEFLFHAISAQHAQDRPDEGARPLSRPSHLRVLYASCRVGHRGA
jgi:hypothetical protein